jgi:hypothetical protein
LFEGGGVEVGGGAVWMVGVVLVSVFFPLSWLRIGESMLTSKIPVC